MVSYIFYVNTAWCMCRTSYSNEIYPILYIILNISPKLSGICEPCQRNPAEHFKWQSFKHCTFENFTLLQPFYGDTLTIDCYIALSSKMFSTFFPFFKRAYKKRLNGKPLIGLVQFSFLKRLLFPRNEWTGFPNFTNKVLMDYCIYRNISHEKYFAK